MPFDSLKNLGGAGYSSLSERLSFCLGKWMKGSGRGCKPRPAQGIAHVQPYT